MSQTTRDAYPDFCGQPLCDEEIALIREVIDSCGLSWRELASTRCANFSMGRVQVED